MLPSKDPDAAASSVAPSLLMSLYPSVKSASSNSVAPAVATKLRKDPQRNVTLPRPRKKSRVTVTHAVSQPGSLARHLAALRIQKCWRRCLSVKNDVDPSTQEPVHRGQRYFLLVESQFVSYKFDGASFAAGVLCSGVFEHPILRRQLLLPEVRRLGQAAGLNAFGREALLVAFQYSTHIIKHSTTRSSLLSFLEDEAGSALNTALERAEFFGSIAVQDDGVSSYADALEAVALTRPEAVDALVAIHQNIVMSRSRYVWKETQEDLLEAMSEAQHEARSLMRRALRSGRAHSLTALGNWVRA